MPRTKKKSVGRYLKRNTLNIAIIAAVLLLVAAIFAVAVLVVELSRPAQPEQTQQSSQAESLPAPEQQPSDNPLPDASGGPEDNLSPPFDGRIEYLADGKLLVTYDDTKLKLTTDGEGLYSLIGTDGSQMPRMDLQQLSGSLSELENETAERLCIGILQAYYYTAPETQAITLSQTARATDSYTAVLSAPAYEGAPAVAAKIRLMQLDKQLWYAIVLMPEGADALAAEQAFDNLMMQ